ncbi:MAG: PilN domain-containing protein [Acetivibrionales bacterium]|jgi:hypothetical protein
MYSVSLLPYEYKLINIKARKKNVNLIIAMGVMGVLFTVYAILSIVLTTNNAKLNEIRKEASEVEAQISEIDDILAMRDQVNKLLKDASLAAGVNPEWRSLTAEIGNSVPESLFLTEVGMKFEDPTGVCIIKGTGSTHESVSEWMNRLEEVPDISEIICTSSALSDQLDENSPVNFEIRFKIQKGRGYQLPTEVTGNE